MPKTNTKLIIKFPIAVSSVQNMTVQQQQQAQATVAAAATALHNQLAVLQQQQQQKILLHNALNRTVSHQPGANDVVSLMNTLMDFGHRKLERTQSEPLPQVNTSRLVDLMIDSCFRFINIARHFSMPIHFADTRRNCVAHLRRPANANMAKNVNLRMVCTNCAIFNAIPNIKPNCVAHSIAAVFVRMGHDAISCTMLKKHVTIIVPCTQLWPVPQLLPAIQFQ